MNTNKTLFRLISTASILLYASFANSQETLNSPHTEILQDAEKILVKLSSLNTIPKSTMLSKLDSSVFFLNSTKDSLLTISINFGKRKAHCASGNMKWFKDEGILKSSEPLAPKDFAVMCFPESGIYNVSVYGLKNDGTATITQVIVP